MVTEFEVRDTAEVFVSWLNNYARQHGVTVPSHIEQHKTAGGDVLLVFWHQTNVDGMVRFEAVERGDVLQVTARPIYRFEDEHGRNVTDEMPPELAGYVQDLVQAIRARWPPQRSKGDSKPREEEQIKTTAAHYGIEKRGYTQAAAADTVGTSPVTYRKYKKAKWLLSDDDFKRITGKPVAQHWETIGGA